MGKQETTGKAVIERGKILTAEASGYCIASIDRDGIETPPISPLIEGESYAVGDYVYYFVFGDGTGRILGQFTV